jgi:flavin-dependent dehydrogenase
MYDLIVVGGGPAGSAAAITTARTGASVLLLERGRFPRHKVCGEFVSAESLGLLASLLGQQYKPLLGDALRIGHARVFMDGHQLDTPVEPPAASITRFDLDLALWESAQECGAETRSQMTVQSISGRGPFRLVTGQGEFEARAVVNASGRWSNLAAAFPRGGAKWLGLKAHFAEADAMASVDLYFFEGGYCGVQPLSRDSINACAMVRADRAGTLAEVFALNPALRDRSRGWKALMDAVSTSPLIFREPEPERDGVLLAGDAAAFVDPFVGDGISLALRSGALAGEYLEAFLRGQGTLETAVSGYRQEYLRRYARIFRNSSTLRRMASLPRGVRKPLLVAMKNAPGIARYVVSKTR